MNYFNKKNIAVIAIVILLIVNISTIGTFAYLSYKKPSSKSKAATERSFKRVHKRMKFTPEQRKLFKEKGSEFKMKSAPFHHELSEIRKEILDELAKVEPDTNLIFKLTDRSAQLHIQLKKNTINHLIELKRSWDPEQYDMLDKLFRVTLSNEGDVRTPQYRMKSGQGGKGRKSDYDKKRRN
jgi:uncharacterized membrane protein